MLPYLLSQLGQRQMVQFHSEVGVDTFSVRLKSLLACSELVFPMAEKGSSTGGVLLNIRVGSPRGPRDS